MASSPFDEEEDEDLIPGSTPEDYAAEPVEEESSSMAEAPTEADDFAAMPEPPAPPAFEVSPKPPQRPALSPDPSDYPKNVERMNAWAARTVEWEERETAKAAQKDFIQSRRAHNAEARKTSAATGAQFNYDENSVAQPLIDPQTGEQKFTKRVSPVRWDEQGRPFQVVQNEAGTRSERISDPDSNAKLGPNPNNPEDPFIYRQTKFQPWEAIDPEEGINSKDGRVVKASAEALKAREMSGVRNELDQTRLALKDPNRTSRLSPEARAKMESDLTAFSSEEPPPAEVKGMFGGVNVEATEKAKGDWKIREQDRQARFGEIQARLQADDERAGLEQKAFDLDSRRVALEQTPLSGYLQERRKKKAESLAALDPEAARAEIETRSAAIAEEDAAAESTMFDLQKRSDALNERTRRGITIQEMESVAAERAAIEADAAGLEERIARRDAGAQELVSGVEAIKAKQDQEREASYAELDRQATKYPELAEDAKTLRAVDDDFRARAEAVQAQPEGPGRQAALDTLNQEYQAKRQQAGSAYVAKLEQRVSGDVGAAIEKIAGPGGAIGFKSQIAALEADPEIDPEIKTIAADVIREQAVDALIRSVNMQAVGPAVKSEKPFSEAVREAGWMDAKNPEDRAKAAQMLEQDTGLGAKLLDGFDRVMTTFGARVFGAVSAVGKAASYRLGLDPDNMISQAAEGGFNYKVSSEAFREKYRDPRLETDDAMNRWIMPAVSEALPNLAGMALTAIPVVGPGLAVTYSVGQLYDEAYSQAMQDGSLSEADRHNAATIYSALALPAELLGDVVTGGVFTARMIPKAAKQQSAEAAAKFWSKFSNVGEVWDKLPPVLKRGVAIVTAGGTEGLTETVQDKILNATIETIKTGDIGASVQKAMEDNRGALDTFIIASISGGGIKTLETATRTLIERGQDPETMARRYTGVANSFRPENVAAYAEETGVTFNPEEYQDLTRRSEGLTMRLDRINPKDKVARNDVARELAQIEARRLTIISEILGKQTVDEAFQQAAGGQSPTAPAGTPPPPVLPENIAAMQAEIGTAPAERQAPLSTAIKILTGAPMDSLTKAEQDAIKPHVAKVGGQTVLTDDILGELSQVSPQAASLMQQGSIRDEAARRLEILATEQEGGDTTNENENQQKGTQDAGQGLQTNAQGNENAQGGGTQTLTPGGAAGLPSLPPLPVGRAGKLVSGKERKVALTLAARLTQNGADRQAAEKFSQYFVKREGLRGWGTEKLNSAIAEFNKAGGMQTPQAIIASVDASDAAQRTEIENFTTEVLKGIDSDPRAAVMKPEDRKKFVSLVREQIAPSLMRFRPILKGVVSYFDKDSADDVQVNRAEKLLINAAGVLASRGEKFWADTENADLLIDEEIGHISQIKVMAEIRRERTGEVGAEDMDLAMREAEEVFLQLPEPLQQTSRKIYGVESSTPGQSGMEFFRQMLQGDIAISEGRILDKDGKVISELAINDRPWIETMKSMFERLFKVFTDLRGNLGTMLRDEGRTDAEIEELTSRVERIRKESFDFFKNLKKEGDRIRAGAYGQEYAARNQTQFAGPQSGRGQGTIGPAVESVAGTGGIERAGGSPQGTSSQLAPAGNALGQDQAIRLAELESRESERAAREERAKERRAEYVATRAGDLKDYEKVVASTPEDAREPVSQLLGQAPSGKAGYVLAVNQRRLPSTWVALPPGVVQTSHIGPNFQKNPEYAGQNTRAYDTDAAEQDKVRAGALPGALNEDILTSTDPSSANSAPQVSIVIDTGPDGQPRTRWQAAGGNAREMMSNLAPQEDQERLSQTWRDKGEQFGFGEVPEGFRGYRFLGVFDIRTEAGARDYQKLVDDLNPSTGVVQDVSDRADLDAKNIPLDLIADLPVTMSGKQAADALSRILTQPKVAVERNRVAPMLKNPAQAQIYMQRVVLSSAFGQPSLSKRTTDYQLQNKNAAFVDLVSDSARTAIQLRLNGAPGIADTLGSLLSNIGDYLDQGRTLKSAIDLAASQIEMDALVGDTAPAVAVTQRLSELVVLDKRGRMNSEATASAMKDFLLSLSSGIGKAKEQAATMDMFGEQAPATMADRIREIIAAHRRRFTSDSETTLSASPSQSARRMRELELKRRQEGLTMREAKELAELEAAAGQQFMDFFQTSQTMKFELEQEVERRGIPRAPVEQMDLVLSAPRSFNRSKAAAKLKNAQRTRVKDLQSRIRELEKTGNKYPHRVDGDWRDNWKITAPGRRLKAPNSGAEFIVQAIDIPGDTVTFVRASAPNERGVTMNIKDAQKRFEVQLTPEELEVEPYFISRLTDFAQMKSDFDNSVEGIAKGQKEAYAVIPELKGAPRALEKIGYRLEKNRESGLPDNLEKLVEDQGGDILRATVLVDSADQIQQTIADILHTFAPDSGNTASTEQQGKGKHLFTSGDGVVKIWIDDRFSAPLESGYSDINLKIQLLPGYWAELQVHIPEMLVAKEGWFDKIPEKYKADILGVPNGKGHKLYEEYRALPDDSPRKAYLEKQMAAIYASAIRKYLSRISISPSQSTSRTKGPYGLGGLAGTTLYPPTNNAGPSGVVTIGIPSSSQNFAPSGNISRFSVTSFIPSSPTREAAASQPVSEILQAAQRVATKAHRNQFRKDGKTAYIEHIRDVVRRLEGASEDIQAAAWLHDVVEDNPNYSFQELKRLGFSEETIAAVRLLTKSPNQSVASYYKNIRQNPTATAVKIADMMSNLADDPSESQRQRYQNGLKYLQNANLGVDIFNQDSTLSAPRRQAADPNQLGFDFSEPAVADYKTTLEAEGITAPQAQAAAAMQDLGIPATEALDLFSYQAATPAANPLTAPDLARREEQPESTNEQPVNTSPVRRNTTPRKSNEPRGTPEPAPDTGLGELFQFVAGIRNTERDSAENPSRSGTEAGSGGGIPAVDGRQSDRAVQRPTQGSGRSGDDAGTLPVSGGLGGQRGRGDSKPAPRSRPRISQPGNGQRVERPPVGSPERNISLSRDQSLAPRGTVSKLRANLAAIRIVQALDSEQRLSTAEEKQELVKFSGWGALSQVFDEDRANQIERGEIEQLRNQAAKYRSYGNDEYYANIVKDYEDRAQALENWKSKWFEAHKEVKALLSDQEYRDARRSTINAHYTSPEIVAGMWDIVKWMGFKGGNILEPGAGIGHFFGLMPEDIADRSKLFGVELDAYTAKILKALYPEADIQNTGFQTADIADNSIDLGISNVPFANVPVKDPALEAMGGPVGNLHDYFFGKTLTKLKPGGIQVFITSAFTMDKGNPEIRKWLAERADLVAAYRLPNDAFRENAGTDVVTDIIILRKKDGKPFPHAQAWTNLDNAKTRRGEDLRINEYFAAHPQNILGQLDNDGSMYGDEKEMTVHGDPARPPAIAMQQDLARLPQGILGDIEATGPVRTNATGVVKVGNIIERDGQFFRQGQNEPDAELNNTKAAPRVRRFLTVRDALNRQYDLELSETATPEEIEANRRALNAAYDRFISSDGYFHDIKNRKLFIDDPDYFRILGAEVEPKVNKGTAATVEEIAAFAKGSKKKIYTKADIFARRVLEPRSEPTQANTIEDAFGISLGWRGRVDSQFMAGLIGKTPDQVETQLLSQEIAVREPGTGRIFSREQYLSGNVRKKLAIARAAGPEYARNVRLLEEVQPKRVSAEDIRFGVGATWIPAQIYNRFLQSLGVNSARFTYITANQRSSWDMERTGGGVSGVEYKDYETNQVPITQMMDSLLNLKAITLRMPEKDGGGIDMNATTAAREKAKKLNARFQQWVRESPDVKAEVEEIYNNEVNAFVQRTYDGQFLQFPWANKDFDIYPDKKNTIWRALQEGFGLIAHGVGGGKTIIGSAIALEMRRLGMARKPMIVVHNATLEGFAKEIAKMAPTARVLVGRKDELAGEKRKEFLMRIAAGDWDAVVIAHSTFGMIEDDPEVEIRTSNALLDEGEANLRERGYKSILEAKEDRKKSPSVKAIVKYIERLQTIISDAGKRRTDTGLLNFQQLGVDALIVDEVHKFKKMPFSTQLEAKGIDGSTSKRAYNLFMRSRQIQEATGGKNVFSMTGTPVTNTLGEIWNMVRLVAPNVLREHNVELFDQFVSRFAQIETEAEMGATGEFKNVDRLSKFVNLPEWNTFLRSAADVKLGDDLVVKNRPGIKGGQPELVAVPRTQGVSSWVAYIRRVLEDFSNLSGETLAENPSLMAVPVQAFMSSRAAAIDIRLIDPRAKDEPGSKVNQMVERLMGLYQVSTPYSGTQVVFADSFNNVRTSLFEGVTSAKVNLELDPTKESGTTFNLYEDIRAKLIARGIPASEIAVITDSAWNSDKKKQALFDAVNEGRIRVVLGSTEKLGTGVNMQRLMIAAHHLDVPWTPAELEQRDGRVFRQGNIHGELGADIELIRYGMSDTLDAALWQKLETKQRFSNAALSGKVTGRELAEDKSTMNLEEQRAVLSGKHGRRMWEINSRLEELDRSRGAQQDDAARRQAEIDSARSHLRYLEAANERIRPSIAKMSSLARDIGANGSRIAIDGQTYDTKTETSEVLKAALDAARESLKLSFDGQQTADPITSITVNGVPIHLEPTIRVDEQWNDEAQRMEQRSSVSFDLLAFAADAENFISFGSVTSPATLLSRLEELGDTAEGLAASRENNLARTRAIASMAQVESWPYQAEYDALSTELKEVEKLYNEDLKKSRTADQEGETLSAPRRQTYDPNQLELDFEAAPRDPQAAQADAEKSAAARFQSALPAALQMAGNYSNIPGVDMDEVRQTARIALANASRSFDAARGVPFEPFASIVVRNRLNQLYRRESLRRERVPQSLDEPMPGDFTETRQDYTPDTATPDAATTATRNEARGLIAELIDSLPERMRAAVDGYLRQRQQEEIGEEFGISKQAVSRLQQEGFKRLRQKLNERGISSVGEILSAARSQPSPADFTPRTEEETKAFEKAKSNKVMARNPQLAVAAIRMKNREIAVGEYADLIDALDPWTMKGAEPIPSDSKIKEYIAKNKADQVGLPIESGRLVELRIDIPTYNRSTAEGDTVYAITAHKPVADDATSVGDVISFLGIAQVATPRFMTRAISGKGQAIDIAAGSGKFPLATVKGNYQAITQLPGDINNPYAWVEVGYNPIRSSFFVDVRSKQAVVGGSEAIMAGSRVFVKNPVFQSRPRGFSEGNTVLFAPPGTPQDDGDFIDPDADFSRDLDELLKNLQGVPADIDSAVPMQEKAALEEGGGQTYQVGRADLAFGAKNPDVRGLDQFYTDRFLPETEAQWSNAATDMLQKDFEGTRRRIEQAGLNGQTISPELTKAADQIESTLRQRMLQTGKDEDRRAYNVFWYAYRSTGTEAGRALAARRDPFKTPAMRHREFLMEVMLSPGKKDKAAIDAEKDPAKKATIIDRVTSALLKKLKDAGITPEDILGNRVVVGLNTAEIQRQFREGLTPKQGEIFDLLLRKKFTPAEISSRTGAKPDAVESVFTAFKNRMRQQHFAKFQAGIHKQAEAGILSAPATQTPQPAGLFGGKVSDSEAEAAFDQWFGGMMGVSDAKKIGRPRFRIDDPAHVMRLARAIQSARGEAGLSDMAYEWWIMNILSGPQTQVVNIAGNSGFLALDTTLQRGMESLVNVFIRDKNSAQLGEFRPLLKGILPGITKGFAMGAKAWSAEHDFYEHTVLGTPLELGQWDKLGNTRSAIPGQAGKVIRIPGRALLFADSFFKQLSGQMNVAAFAYRIAKAEGLTGQALTDRVALLSKTRNEVVSENMPSAAPSQEMVEYFARQIARRDQSLDVAALVANRSSEAWELAREQAAYDAAKAAGWTEDAWIRAVDKSKEMTFQQDLQRRADGGNLFEDAAAKLQDSRFNNQLIGFFFPFVKTPYNIFRTGIRKSPLGAANFAFQAGKGFLSMKDGKPFLEGDPTLVRDLSEQLIAWTAMALIFGAVQGDEDDDDKLLLITGSQPRNESSAGIRELNTRSTGGEYVIRIGGRNGITIPYGRLDPIATVLGTTVDLIRSIKQNGTPTENLASVWNYMVAQTNSKTFLQGIANIATILEGRSDPVGATQRTILQALVPNIIRQPLRNLDDYVRDTKTAPATYTLLPSGNLAEPKIDIYGNEIRKGSNPVMRLFLNSALATEPTLQSTDRLLLNWNTRNPSMAYAPEQAKAIYKGRDGKEKEMTAEEARRYRLAAGRLAASRLRTVTTPTRIANPTEADIQEIRNIFSTARTETRERMFAGR